MKFIKAKEQIGAGQSLVKVSQIQSNLIDVPVNTGLGAIHIRILIIEIEEYGDICVGKIWEQLDDQIEKT